MGTQSTWGVSLASEPSRTKHTTTQRCSKMKLFIAVAACLLAVVASDSTPDFFELPSNATAVLQQGISYGFDCSQRRFGYYADTSNNCQIFHLCYPFEDADGEPQLRMWSFLCGLGTMFDQSSLTCNYPEDSLPCQDAPSVYDEINEYFHREDLEFRAGLTGGAIFK